MSIKYGVGGINRFDIGCLAVALIGIFLWLFTKNPLTALYINIAVEAVGYLPTIKKSYLQPDSESTISWTMAAIASVVNLFAITSFSFKIALYPIVLLVLNGTLALLLLRPHKAS